MKGCLSVLQSRKEPANSRPRTASEFEFSAFSDMFPLPAHATKDTSPLNYPLTPSHTVQIVQKAPLDSVSTGTTLYLSSQLLAHYLQETRPRGSKAIELGAGTGLVSLALGILGWQVWATDLSNVIDDVLRVNIDQNRHGEIIVQELDWTRENCLWTGMQGIDADTAHVDLITGADCIYSMELIPHLLRTLQSLCDARSPLILMAFERRDSAVIDTFFAQSKVLGFTSKKINLRRILGRQITRWGWTPDDWQGVELWSMRLNTKS